MGTPIALQLHTVREGATRDLAGVLERIARIGYLGVETAGLYGMPPDEFRRRVDDLGLEIVGAFGPGASGWDPFLDEQQALANDSVVSSLMPEHFASADAVARAAEEFNAIAERVRSRGMTLGYHNHTWEFKTSDVGWIPMDSFLEQLDPGITLVADIYWVKSAGVDPAAWLAPLGTRVGRVHVKDGPATPVAWPDGPPDIDPQTAVGAGTLDIAAALAACPHVDGHVVELDECDGDAFEAVEASYRYLTERGLSQGRQL